MAFPLVLKDEVARVFHVEPQVLWVRHGPVPSGGRFESRGGLLFAGAWLAFLGVGPGAGRRVAGVSGGIGALLWGLWAVAALPEVTWNAILALWWPVDLVALAWPDRLRRWATIRAGWIALWIVASWIGWLDQPLVLPGLIAGLPWALVAIGSPWRRARGSSPR
jgi:hypothetical protein